MAEALSSPRLIVITLLLRTSTAFLGRSVSAASPFRALSTTRWTMATNNKLLEPPLAERQSDSVFYAGAAPPSWKSEFPRQSESSIEPMMDPPLEIANPYGWMRSDDRSSTKVIEHLNAENAYTAAVTEHLEPLRKQLYDELLSAIQETDYTTPRPRQGYYYYTRTIEGQSYTVHCRAPRTSSLAIDWDGSKSTPILSGEQVTLDVNEIAKDQPYCSLGAARYSPSQKLLAYSVDFSGDETCQMFVKDLDSGEIVDHDETLEMSGSLQWGKNDTTLFYLKQDAEKRPYQLWRRTLGADTEDELLYTELDRVYYMGMYKSLDGRYLFLETSSSETSEIRYLDLDDPSSGLELVAKRRPKVLYEVEHRNGRWWIFSNVGSLPNMALFTAPARPDNADEWTLVQDTTGQVLFEGGNERSLDSLLCLANHVVAAGREGGLPRIWVLSSIDNGETSTVGTCEQLTFAETAYDVGMGTHYEFETDKLVVTYDSMVTPPQSLEIDLADTSSRTVLKEKNVPGYDKSLYGCERLTVQSRDGKAQIPVSMVYRKDVMEKHLASGEPVHTHLYGYGSYCINMEADFGSTRLPLLNRGVVYVTAHVRGGGEMGRTWYEEPNGAKYLCKKNTFNDFVDVARWLINDRNLTSSDKLSCEGRSAGGLLIGSSINQAPELFKAAILGVPFVDVVATMTDSTIPLTCGEWEEWGNPNEIKYHQYMME